ncbi:MAG: tetratricopeptide repeat protein [Clostridium sp.]
MRGFIKKYKEVTEKKPNLESGLIVAGVCLFAFLTSFICKIYFSEEVKNTELILNEEERNYYEGNYDKAIEEIKNKDEEIFPKAIMKEGIIRGVNGETLLSNALAEKAYIQSRIALDTHGYEKYKEEVKNLSNDIVLTYLLNGEVLKAIEYGEFFLGEYNDNYKLQKTLATAYIANGQKDRGIQTIDRIKLVKETSYELSELGEIYISSGEYEKGIDNLKRSYNLDKENINILQILKEYNEDRELKKYLEKDGKEPLNKMFLAQMEIMSDRDYNKGIDKINSLRDKGLCRLYLEFQVSKNSKDRTRMDVLRDEVKEKYDNTFGGNYVLAEYYIEAEELGNATHYANKSIELNKNYGKIYGVLFPEIVSLDEKSKVNAGPYIREGLTRNPYSVEILKKGAKYYNDLEKFDIAYNYINFIVKIERYDYKNYIQKATLEELKEKEIAIQTLENALMVDQSNGELYNYLGTMYLEEGNNEEGIKNIRKAYEVDSENIKSLNNAAVYYTRYEKNIWRAYSNIKSANENIKWSTDTKVKETIRTNLSLIEKVHNEVTETNNPNWELENLELLK